MAGKRNRTGGRLPPEVNPDTGEPFRWTYQIVRPRELRADDPQPFFGSIYPSESPLGDYVTWCCVYGHATRKKATRHARYVVSKGHVVLFKRHRDWSRNRARMLRKIGVEVPASWGDVDEGVAESNDVE